MPCPGWESSQALASCCWKYSLVKHVLGFLLTFPPDGSLGQQSSTLAAGESHLGALESPDAWLLAAPGSIASELLAQGQHLTGLLRSSPRLSTTD